MSEQQTRQAFDKATRDVAARPDLVAGAIAGGRRRQRRNAVVSGLLATGVVVAAAALVGGALLGGVLDGSSGPRSDTGRDPDLFATARPSPSADADSSLPEPGGLAGKLVAALAGEGVVTDARNWLPWGEDAEAMGGPALADGVFGFGGGVRLDGALVTVTVHANDDGPENPCGHRAVENGVDGGCRVFRGGHLLTAEGPGATGTKKDGASATFFTPEVVVNVIAVEESAAAASVLDLHELSELAADPRFRTPPYQ